MLGVVLPYGARLLQVNWAVIGIKHPDKLHTCVHIYTCIFKGCLL